MEGVSDIKLIRTDTFFFFLMARLSHIILYILNNKLYDTKSKRYKLKVFKFPKAKYKSGSWLTPRKMLKKEYDWKNQKRKNPKRKTTKKRRDAMPKRLNPAIMERKNPT